MTSSGRRAWTSAAATAPGVGRRPVLTLADRLLATILHQRLALPQTAIAALSGVRPETVNKRIRDIRQLLDQAGYTIQPGPHRLASLEDLSKRPPPKASSPRHRSRQRVNDLQALARRGQGQMPVAMAARRAASRTAVPGPQPTSTTRSAAVSSAAS